MLEMLIGPVKGANWPKKKYYLGQLGVVFGGVTRCAEVVFWGWGFWGDGELFLRKNDFFFGFLCHKIAFHSLY